MADPGSVSPPYENPALTKDQATAKYNALMLKANNFPADSSHQKKYLAIARAVLSTYLVTVNGGSAAHLRPAKDVKTIMTSLLPPLAVNLLRLPILKSWMKQRPASSWTSTRQLAAVSTLGLPLVLQPLTLLPLSMA